MPTGNQPLERCDARISGRTDLLIIVATLMAALAVVSDPAPLRAGVATAGSQSVAGAPRGVARAAVSVHRRMSTSTRSRFEHNMPADADFDPVDTDEEDRDERERVRSRARSERPDPEPGRFAAWKTHPPGWFDHYGECAAAASVTGDSGRRTQVTGRARRTFAPRSIGDADGDGDGDGDAEGSLDTVALIHFRTSSRRGSYLPAGFHLAPSTLSFTTHIDCGRVSGSPDQASVNDHERGVHAESPGIPAATRAGTRRIGTFPDGSGQFLEE